jgi:ComF family protein
MRCFVPFHYQAPISGRIRALKFSADLPAARELAHWMWMHGAGRDLPQALLPVPLHRKRLMERGFNQALELARELAALASIPVLADRCVRLRHTAAQSGLEARHRRRNVRGVFRVKSLEGLRHVAIVDDVVTTGSTVTELARALRRGGIEAVEVWAAARATRRP